MNRTVSPITALLLAGAFACASDSPADPGEPGPGDPPPTAFVRSVALSPAGFPTTFAEIPSFLQEAGSIPGAGVMWNGAWRDDVIEGTDAGAHPEPAVMTVTQAPAHGYAPILVFGWRGGDAPHIRIPHNPVNDWSNAEAAELYRKVVVEMAEAWSPPFLFLGNESDHYYDVEPVDYERWIDVYEAAYQGIKAVSPETRVGPIFQYERMAGIGVLAGQTTSSWEALTLHDLDLVDVVGITLYPFFAHATPDQVPDDYLDPLFERIQDTPVAVTESGWPAERPDGFDPPWATSEDYQVAYVDTLERILADRAVPLVTWVWLHPPAAPSEGGLNLLEWNIFHSLSLRRASGEERPVYEAWRNLELENASP
jgi:hypothetical protein